MEAAELIKELRDLAEHPGDTELTHIEADEALLRFIDDEEVTKAFHEIDKWYA